MRWEGLVAILGCLVLTVAGPASAAQGLSGLDLRLKPGDVAPSPPAPYRAVTGAPTLAELAMNLASTLDQGPQAQTPNRRKSGTGSLDALAGDDEFLKQLLEDKTIPLFRIRVEPPF
ncbi:MAG: hypothetical protein AB7I59_12250 [Geminicoccaceae bacterium]